MYKPAFNTTGLRIAVLALFATLATPALAENNYRAEIVILERMAEPVVREQMADKRPQDKDADKRLWVVDESGNVRSDLQTLNNLTLNTAASRLENSGKYRVLLRTGWNQAFPPDFDGEPLRVEIGEFLEQAGHRDVEGTIEINRRRYLLVDVQLNHWREATGSTMDPGTSNTNGPRSADAVEPAASSETAAEAGTSATEQGAETAVATEGNQPAPQNAGTSLASEPQLNSADGKELITWIRETRRMRSEEVHFLDSPTIGVLVYFKPLD